MHIINKNKRPSNRLCSFDITIKKPKYNYFYKAFHKGFYYKYREKMTYHRQSGRPPYVCFSTNS